MCSKVPYRTRRKAIRALESCRSKLARTGDPRRRERAVYKCPACGMWHLTSVDNRSADDLL
jgi:hypothetical protein